jgi:hypothetical protein
VSFASKLCRWVTTSTESDANRSNVSSSIKGTLAAGNTSARLVIKQLSITRVATLSIKVFKLI